MSKKKVLTCPCIKQECWRSADNKLPTYCEARIYIPEIEQANKAYSNDDNVDIYKASCAVRERNNGMTPRIEEAILYAKELNLKRIGFAACVALNRELGLLAKLFKNEGFEVYTACCQIGGIDATERGVPEVQGFSASLCNPIAQAEILNKEKTDINFIIGLCMGHDILFNRHSKAPVSTLIVKDRVTGNNPAAALYGWHQRKHLFGMSLENTDII